MAGPAYFDAFRRIVVQPDNITISADAVDDTLTLVAGAGISLVANANSDQITIVNTNSGQFSLAVAGDDSTLRTINSGETIRFAGTGGVTVTSNAEGAITINGPNLAAVSQNIIPTADVTYDIGSSTNRFRDIYLAGKIINNNKEWTFGTDGSLEFPAGYILPNTIGAPGQTLIAGGQGSISWADLPSYLTSIPNDVTIGGVRINTNLIQTVDSNADLELDASGTGAIQLRSRLKLSDGTSPDGLWTNFTPTWTAGTSNPSIGNGILEGTYKRVGNTVHVWMMMTAGSTTTFGSGEYKISLPVTARAISRAVLNLVMNNDGTRLYNSLAHNGYTTTLSLDSDNVTLFWDTGVVTHNSPFAWASGDWFIISGTYEAS